MTQVKRKYDATLFMMFAQLFEVLPIATVVSGKVFVVSKVLLMCCLCVADSAHQLTVLRHIVL